MKVLIIEDDKDIAGIERDFLEINGFEVSTENNGIKGMERALKGGFDLILLDLMLPGKNGYEICKAIREKSDIPVLMVTARTEDIDKVRGLGLGADDYISKPFSPTELVARVKAHIARYERLTKNTPSREVHEIDLGWLKINLDTHQVFVNQKETILTNKEYELLYFLVANAEMVFSKEQLYDKIWGEEMYGDMKTVAVHINRLREKVETENAQGVKQNHIQTVWGAGYRFMP